MARRPGELPAKVEPLPDWTLLVHPHIYSPSPHLQRTGSCQRRQAVEVKGQHVLTCTETDCCGLRLVHRIAADTVL